MSEQFEIEYFMDGEWWPEVLVIHETLHDLATAKNALAKAQYDSFYRKAIDDWRIVKVTREVVE
jgi:hypothetical protein